MPSPSQPVSAPGFAFVTATAILANPRSISGTKFIIFDAQLYIGPHPHNILLGSLRYFNLSNQVFSEDAQLYQLHFTVRHLDFSFYVELHTYLLFLQFA